MPYSIHSHTFKTKNEVTEYCRAILRATPDGISVEAESQAFLFELFKHHDEWAEKADGGVVHISTQTTPHGTRCFVLVKRDNLSAVDISFPHAIGKIPSTRTVPILPQSLKDFKKAARTAVNAQIYEFRDRTLLQDVSCPITGARLARDSCAVDHVPPKTFDQLLYNFCRAHSVNPLHVEVGSEGGTVAVITNEELRASWESFHRNNAELRLLTRIGNLQLPKANVPWSEFF